MFNIQTTNTAALIHLDGKITNNEGSILHLQNGMFFLENDVNGEFQYCQEATDGTNPYNRCGFSNTVEFLGDFINNTVKLGSFSEVKPNLGLDAQNVPISRIKLSGLFMNNRYMKSFQIDGFSQVQMSGKFVNCGHLHPELSEFQEDGGLVTVYPRYHPDRLNSIDVENGVFNHTMAMQAIRVMFPEDYADIPSPINGSGYESNAYITNIDYASFNNNGEIGVRKRACKDIFITQTIGNNTDGRVLLCDPSCSVVHPILSLCPHGCKDSIHGGYQCQKDTDGDGVGDEKETTDGTNPNNPCSFKHSSQLALNHNGKSFLKFTSLAYRNDDCDGDGFTNYAEQCKID